MIMFRMYVWLADDEEIRVRDSFQFGQRRQHRESCEWSQNSTSTAPGRKPTKLHITYLRKWACEATRDHHRRGLLDRMKPPSIFEGKQDRTGHVNVRQRKEKSNSAMVYAVGTFSWIICHKSSNSCKFLFHQPGLHRILTWPWHQSDLARLDGRFKPVIQSHRVPCTLHVANIAYTIHIDPPKSSKEKRWKVAPFDQLERIRLSQSHDWCFRWKRSMNWTWRQGELLKEFVDHPIAARLYSLAAKHLEIFFFLHVSLFFPFLFQFFSIPSPHVEFLSMTPLAPEVWPSVNAMAESYRLAQENPELGSAVGFSVSVKVSGNMRKTLGWKSQNSWTPSKQQFFPIFEK